jgi:hypothetical protein
MRLPVPVVVGLVVDPLVPTREPQEPTTVTQQRSCTTDRWAGRARRLVDHLAEGGVRLSAFGVQKLLRRHRLGRRAQRWLTCWPS